MNVQPWRTAAMLLAACGLLSSCRLAKQRVDFTWFRDACTSPQNDTVHIEAGRGLPQGSAPAATAKRQLMPWQQQENALSLGQEPRQQTAYAPSAAAASPAASYTVQPGDTLSGIARKCHVSLASLYSANGLNAETARGLRPGQTLHVTRPATHGAAQAAASPQQPVAPRQQASADYTVRKGDTLSAIAARNHTSTAGLIRANRLTPQQANRLKIGQKLIIPRH